MNKLNLEKASEYTGIPMEEIVKLEEWEIWDVIDAINSKHAEGWY